jgi:hypothetical protein
MYVLFGSRIDSCFGGGCARSWPHAQGLRDTRVRLRAHLIAWLGAMQIGVDASLFCCLGLLGSASAAWPRRPKNQPNIAAGLTLTATLNAFQA